MTNYMTKAVAEPKNIGCPSAWEPLSRYVEGILNDFNVPRKKALEFGVERGYSLSVLANYFEKVTGVDSWDWEIGDGVERTLDSITRQFKDYKNVKLINESSDDYIKTHKERYDLIHVDIGYETHTYEPTLRCGEWSVKHADCILFHDTMAFPEVAQACQELADKYGFEFYNLAEEEMGKAGVICGLGILIKKK